MWQNRTKYTALYIQYNSNFQAVARPSMISKALIRSMSKSMLVTHGGQLMAKLSFLVSIGLDSLLLLLNLWCFLKLVFGVLNLWLLLIPGVYLFLVMSWSISWSLNNNLEDSESVLRVSWLEEQIVDVEWDLKRWWSHNTSWKT